MTPIVYGTPSLELFEAAERGDVFLGGRLVSDNNPTLRCPKCQPDPAV